jgi:hypothetical protein
MTTGQRQLFPQFSTHYLKALGELLLCGIALQSILDADKPCSEAWRARANELVEESVRIGEAAAGAAGHRGVLVDLPDGSMVVADAEYLNRLVRKMDRHHSIGLLQLAGQADELVAS